MNFTATATAEVFVPGLDIWTNTGSMKEARSSFTATLLTNGLVLVAGGNNASGALATAELYDPVTGQWSLTSSMTNARSAHTATLLKNGKVLVAGGESAGVLSQAEIYDAAQGLWSVAGPMLTARSFHSATLLEDGRVLVVGGRDGGYNPTGSAEVYDSATNGWTFTGEMNFSRWSHTATRLPLDGRVLVVGGRNLGGELFDPISEHWTLTLIGGITNVLQGQTATLLANGSVLVAGGIDLASTFETITNAWLYDPRTATWSITAGMNQGRYVQTATALPNGVILVAGGGDLVAPFRLASTESFVPLDSIFLTAATVPSNGQFQIAFTNTPGFGFVALGSTNISLPLSNWTALGGVTEISPGQFQFTDSQATNGPQRFYRVRAN